VTGYDFQMGLLWRVLKTPWRIFETKADDLSALMKKQWGVTVHLRDLPDHPRWMINATCHETGKNWRFERFRMGDYRFGYTTTRTSLKRRAGRLGRFPWPDRAAGAQHALTVLVPL